MPAARALPILEQITVATPCSASWDDMEGDERVRHCGSCDLDVFNLSGMTRAEARALLVGRTGRLCVRFFRRHDGTVITQDCPTALANARRRALLFAAAVASVFAFFASLAFAATIRRGPQARADVFDSPTVRTLTAAFSGNSAPATPQPTPVVHKPVVVMGGISVQDYMQHPTP